jgi:YesN/AraC family two-component response regulator
MKYPNITIYKASNGRTVLGLLKERRADTVISDINMPEISSVKWPKIF